MTLKYTFSTLVLLVILALLPKIQLLAQDDAPVINTTGLNYYCENCASIIIDPNLTITDADGGNMTGAKVSINNFKSDDILSFTSLHGITGSYNTANGVLSLNGTGTATDYQDILRTVEYSSISGTIDTTSREINFTIGENTLYNSATGHYYEFIASPGILWTTAKEDADVLSFYGLQGYLITITSAEENAFIVDKFTGSAWIGATDETVDETWRWVTGPEGVENGGLGRHFFNQTPGGTGGSAVDGYYINWNTDEPNNYGTGEEYAHMMSWTTPAGMWNDLPDGAGGGDYASTGYIIEYGGMPGDPVLLMESTTLIRVSAEEYVIGSSYTLNFDGINEYLSCGTNATLKPTTAITVEAWVYPETLSDWEGIMSYSQDNLFEESGYSFTYYNGKLRFFVARQGMTSDDWNDNPGYNVTLNKWTHVAGTYDGSTLKMYVNGKLVESEAQTGNIDWTYSPLDFRIGSYYDDDEETFFDGKIDELRVWNTARTNDEIQDNIHKSLAGDETGLIAYWQFNEGTNGVTNDFVGCNSGSLTNMDNSNWESSKASIATIITHYRYEVAGTWLNDTINSSNIFTIAKPDITGNNKILFGHDSLLTQEPNIVDIPSGINNRCNRVWRTEIPETSTSTVNLYIDCSDFSISDGNNLRLLEDDDGTFINASIHLGSYDNATKKFTINNKVITNGNYYTIGSTTANNTLPIELISFNAYLNQDKKSVNLKWITSSEINNDYFEIQRSTNAKDFIKIGTINGYGNSNKIIDYNFTDSYIPPGNIYYRLKQVDYDGKNTFSNIESIYNNTFNDDCIIYPNPINVGNKLYVKTNTLPENSLINYQIIDSKCNQLVESQFYTPNNKSETAIHINNHFKPGIYTLILKTKDLNYKQRFIVL